ncbi:MAG: ATP-binding cassette domain-containing protein [Firmicutes bacterium]|nr:ATP-binding cassette domain-containing protein [Bacillota bacterium]
MIEALGLTKRFPGGRRGGGGVGGEVVAVRDVRFVARPGEVFGLLGENGAGKTTTLRLLATILKPSAGTARVMGYDVVREPEKVRRSIGVVATDTGLYDRLTPREILRYFGELNDLPRHVIEARARELFARLNMEEYADRRAGELSRGTRQKVHIARAMVADPPVLLLDEPTAGLDVTSSRAVEDFILEARREGKTVVFSSHIMSQVERVCDRVAVIHHGSIVAEGTIDELKGHRADSRFEDVFVRLVGEEGGR